MDSQDWLWEALHELFETDDRSRPEVRIDFVDPAALLAAFERLREHAAPVERAGQPLDEAARLVVAGEAEPLHVLLTEVRRGGVRTPNLGVFVYPDQLALDYRMGPEWGPQELAAFFGLLAEAAAFDPRASVSVAELAIPEVQARFQAAWAQFKLAEGTPPAPPEARSGTISYLHPR